MAYHHGNLREALIERAAEVIAERGIEALSLRALARDLGVSHAAPSAHFPDRRALLCALAREGFRRSVDTMNAGAEAAGPDPVARYRALGRSYVQFARDNPSYFRAINHPEVEALQDDELQESRDAWVATLREGVEIAQAAGWHPEIDVETLLAFSCAGAMGAARLLTDSTWCSMFEVEDLDALADSVLDLVVHRSRTSVIPIPEDQRRVS
ncbi:MAG TPA: TetR/AcrR family transcriptional regulator [Myxococcales bacterium]|nr:TetR/AcrR family transcriptional regulator [Myxococcales bacterium]HIK84014.1 TetR/AcrR family transcriptional regulator [Myxococcales bacterium]